MIDFVPTGQYAYYFNITILVMMGVAFWQCSVGTILRKDVASFNATWGFIFSVLLILYMGLRPATAEFGDTVNYANTFYRMQESTEPFVWQWKTEWFFNNMQNWFAKHSDIHMFFAVCAFLYIAPLWLAMRRMFGTYSYIPLLVIMGMFSFWTYGVNGVRNGIGASLFILAISYVNNIPLMFLFAFLAIGFHTSILLMIGAGVMAWFVKNSYIYLAIWIISILVSYAFGGTIQSFLANLSIFSFEERFEGYLTQETDVSNVIYVSSAFRWDLIAYSALGTIMGYYFIFRRNFKDEYYHWIYNIYLICNAFWILIIRAAFSNRFAQISWFILPVVLIYPFMKQRFWVNHEKMLGYALILFYIYTFFENFIRSGQLMRMF